MERVFRHIVRIVATDISGEHKLPYGLAEIKGVGYNLALSICRITGLDPNMKIGYLTDDEVRKIEEAINRLRDFGVPNWMLNRRKDYETGEDKHLVGASLLFYVKQDIEREIKIRSWRGVRHAGGYKVRGQRTRTTGRTGATVGVRKKKQPGGK